MPRSSASRFQLLSSVVEFYRSARCLMHLQLTSGLFNSVVFLFVSAKFRESRSSVFTDISVVSPQNTSFADFLHGPRFDLWFDLISEFPEVSEAAPFRCFVGLGFECKCRLRWVDLAIRFRHEFGRSTFFCFFRRRHSSSIQFTNYLSASFVTEDK